MFAACLFACGGGGSSEGEQATDVRAEVPDNYELPDDIEVPDNAEVFQYSFEEKNTANALNTAHDFLYASIYGAKRVDGLAGRALEFDGSGFIFVPTPTTKGIYFLANQFHADALIKLTDESDTNGTIMGDSFGGNSSYRWYIQNRKIKISFTNAGMLLQSNTELQMNTWYYLNVDYDGQFLRMYINGELDASSEVLFDINTSVNHTRIADRLAAVIDEPRLASFSRNSSEIRAYYRQLINGEKVNSAYEFSTNPIGKIIHYSFDESKTVSVVNKVESQYDGVASVARRVPGVRGDAMRFDDSLGSIQIRLSSPTTNEWRYIDFSSDQYSVTAWFNFNASIQEGKHDLIGTSSSGLNSIDIDYNDGQLVVSFYANYSRADMRIKFPLSFKTDIWQHFALVYSGNRILVYLDAELVAEKDFTYNLSNVYNSLYIGASSKSGFIGAIDEFQLFDRALSPREVQESMSENW